MKKKCLLIFKWPIYAQKFLINKFSKFYETEHIFISDYKTQTYSKIIKEINELIKSKNIQIVFFDSDFIKLINLFFIKKIEVEKKILMTFDDAVFHEMNAITANACDIVLSHCPLSIKKYEEKGYEAFFMPCEGDSSIFKNYNLKKEIDVLFFGQMNSDRKEFLDFLENNGISIKKVGYHSDFVSEEELSKLVSKSKIVLNLSKTIGGSVANKISEDIYKFYYQFKGRVIISGLCGTLCISEYSPGQEILFNRNEIPTFYTKEECLEILRKFLEDSNLLSKYQEAFSLKVQELCEDKKNFQPIYDEIEKAKHRKVNLAKIPYWYSRIAAKQIILRNIKLSRLKETIFEFREIFTVIKKSNLKTKILVIAESILNLFWYSVIRTLKNKN